MNTFQNRIQGEFQYSKSKCPYPNYKKFFAPIVVTMNLMYLSAVMSTSYNSELQNGMLFFGCAIGSKLYGYLKKFQSRIIFYLTDLIVLLILLYCQTFILLKQTSYQIENNQTTYQEGLMAQNLVFHFIIGIMGGANLLQVILYLKLTNTEYDLQFFSLFIPFQFAIGSVIQLSEFNFLIVSCVILSRSILITVFRFEALSQNIQQMEQAQQNSQTTTLVVDVIQAQQQIQNDKFVISFLRNFKYLIIVVIFQTSSMPFHLHISQIIIVTFHLIVFHLIDKNKTVIFGQICICFGYCFTLQPVSIFGYYFGLGTLFYSMLCKIQTEDLIVISEINWIIRLSTMCFIAVMQSISQSQFLLESGVESNVFFILNFINLIFLYIVLFTNKNEKNKVEIEQQLKEEIKQDENELIIEQ